VDHDIEKQLGFDVTNEALIYREVARTADGQKLRYPLKESEEQRVMQWNRNGSCR